MIRVTHLRLANPRALLCRDGDASEQVGDVQRHHGRPAMIRVTHLRLAGSRALLDADGDALEQVGGKRSPAITGGAR